MTNCMLRFLIVFLLGVNVFVFAQDNTNAEIIDPNVFNHYTETLLSNTDTIPGFKSTTNKLKITGTIYKSDGVTPAEGVILYIEQADEYGDFDVRTKNDIRYVHNRGWVKTDADGKYTFYTYVPGNDRRYNLKQQLYPIIKEPSKPEYAIGTFLFDEDPLLSKLCRKRMAKKGDPTRILKLNKVDELFITIKDIVLRDGIAMAN